MTPKKKEDVIRMWRASHDFVGIYTIAVFNTNKSIMHFVISTHWSRSVSIRTSSSYSSEKKDAIFVLEWTKRKTRIQSASYNSTDHHLLSYGPSLLFVITSSFFHPHCFSSFLCALKRQQCLDNKGPSLCFYAKNIWLSIYYTTV